MANAILLDRTLHELGFYADALAARGSTNGDPDDLVIGDPGIALVPVGEVPVMHGWGPACLALAMLGVTTRFANKVV